MLATHRRFVANRRHPSELAPHASELTPVGQQNYRLRLEALVSVIALRLPLLAPNQRPHLKAWKTLRWVANLEARMGCCLVSARGWGNLRHCGATLCLEIVLGLDMTVTAQLISLRRCDITIHQKHFSHEVPSDAHQPTKLRAQAVM